MSFLLRSILLCVLILGMPNISWAEKKTIFSINEKESSGLVGGDVKRIGSVYAKDIPHIVGSDDLEKIYQYPKNILIHKTGGGTYKLHEVIHPESWKSGSLQMVKDVLRAGVNFNARDKSGHTLTMYVAARGTAEQLKYLRKNGADLRAVSKKNLTVLAFAVSADNPRVIKYLIKHTDVNILSDFSIGKMTILGEIVEFYPQYTVDMLRAGAKVDQPGLFISPLYKAADLQPDLVDTLLEAGADPNLPLMGAEIRPLDAAVQTQPHVIASLLKAGADPNRIYDFPGSKGKISTMIWASMSSCYATQELLKANISKKVINMSYGEATPIMFALYRVQENKIADRKYCKGLIQKMLEAGADPDPNLPANTTLYSAIFFAKYHNLKQEAKIIQEYINKKDDKAIEEYTSKKYGKIIQKYINTNKK